MMLNGHANEPLVVPTPRGPITLPPLARLLLTQAQQRERTRLLMGRYFLVNMRLGNLGEIFRCSRCNGKHERLTRYCIERPFSGLLGGLYAYTSTLDAARNLDMLPPEHRARVEALRTLFGATDLGAHHPQLARQLAHDPTRPSGEVDLDLGMIALGVLERISPGDAQRLLDRINHRAGLYSLPLVTVPGLKTPGGAR